MKPKSVSASSLAVAELCMSRYYEEHIKYAKSPQGDAASVGIVLHGTLEDFLRGVYIRKDFKWSMEKFWELFEKNALEVLGPDKTTDLYLDAKQLAKRWINNEENKEELDSVKILSLESKNKFPLKTSQGEIPVNYIMDRLEQIGENEYRVTDYKSNRVPLTSAQLRKKLQAKLYALMVQIKYPKAEKIWVRFEFLRHDNVEVLFKRDDNKVTYRELQRRVEMILDTDETNLKETLNSDCGYCVRKASCKQLLGHAAAGGVLGKNENELAEIHARITSAQKAQKILLTEVEDLLLKYALENQMLEFDTTAGTVHVEMKYRRQVDSPAALEIIGDLVKDYPSVSVSTIDDIVKKELLPDEDLAKLKKTVRKKPSDPSIRVDPNGV